MSNTNGKGFVNGAQAAAVATIERIAEVGLARPALYIERRLDERAAEMSEAGRAAAVAALLNRALLRYGEICWEPVGNKPAGLDWVTGRCLLPAPWTTTSYRIWGLRRIEQAVLLRYMRLWSARPAIPPVWVYDAATKRWFGNLQGYTDLRSVVTILQRGIVSVEAVIDLERKIRAKDLARKARTGRS
jgi:hypothetical protein